MLSGAYINDRLAAGAEGRPPRPLRRAPRVALDAEVMLRRAGRNNYRVRVYDMSPQGCRVEFVERPNLDELLWVKFEGLDAIEASVCWTGGPAAGLEFVRPVHPAVFEHLLRRLTIR